KLVPLPDGHELHRLIVCKTKVGKPGGSDAVQLELRIGVHELIEGVAHILEEMFFNNLKVSGVLENSFSRPRYAPYLLIRGLAALLAPKTSETSEACILLAALGALQSNDPISRLFQLLEHGEASCAEGKDPEAAIRELARRLFDAHLPAALDTLKIFEDVFDKDERMSRAVRKLVGTLRANLAHRQDDLFFEIEVAKNDVGGKEGWVAACSRYGAPLLFLESGGDADRLQKDKMRFLDGDPSKDKEAVDQRRLLFATFNYMLAHLHGDYKSGKPQPRFSPCPFYTSCGHELRIRAPHQCKETPWLSLQDDTSRDVCDYAVATSKFEGGRKNPK
uniref:hypothetical protein n=1 Tax=Paraburkholderia kururiensis TaxID=984307 RepID=UPI001C3F2502